MQVVVQFPDALDHERSDLVASQPGFRFGPALDSLLLDALGRQEAAPELLQLLAGSDLTNRWRLNHLLFRKYLLRH